MPELRPSPGALLRLIRWPQALLRGGAFLFVTYYFFEGSERLAAGTGLPVPPGAALWPAWFIVSSLAALGFSTGSVGDLRTSALSSMLPGLEAGLRRGLTVLATALGVTSGFTGLALGLGMLEALALAVFSAGVFLVAICASIWAARVESPVLWPLLAFGLPTLPVVTLFLAPALPWRLGTAQPLLTVVTGLLLATALLRRFPLLEPRGHTGEAEGADEETDEETEEGQAPDPTIRWLRRLPSPAPLPRGAWIRTPVRTGIRFWWLELSGRPLAGAGGMLTMYGVVALLSVLIAMATKHWLFLAGVLVLFRPPSLAAPLGAFPIPVGRVERARIAWTADLLQSAVLVAGAAGFLVLASLVSPDRMLAVSGPHPALVLAALAVCLPLNGAMIAALQTGDSAFAIGRHILSKVVVILLVVALVRGVELSPPAAAWPLLLAAAVAGPAAAWLLFRRHLARCPLGPGVGG